MKKGFLIMVALMMPLFYMNVVLNGMVVENVVAVENSDTVNSDTKLSIEDDGMTHVGISPYDIHLDLSPGSSYTETFKVLNYGAKTMEYSVKVSPYMVDGEDYNPNFETESNYTQLSKWIALDKNTGTLESGGIEEITYHIDVPEDVAPGGQYAAITVSATDQPDANSGDGFQIAVNVGVAYIVYGNVVGGETRVEATVLKNSIAPFVLDGKISAESLIENTGNTHVEAKYVLQVYPLFSDEEIYTNEDSPATRTILPGTSRVASSSWEETPVIGVFKVVHTIMIGDEAFSQENYVVKCPVWLFVLIFFVVFFVLISIIALIVRKISKSKKSKKNPKTSQ